ncbi:Putative Ubiquitin carboxyl-terminal hydrolase [[Torrubiella] hemipterigena]|uniref:Ubiquitin carboxyl-terminal hydrolase n=1 Tax=[Torrubiella] hemipterigena TaxID=1531966 RepID=A0A0A1SWK8_9HYPO|nr:Putative Ubiquitin carboxyl-terminal hydrolase [[Torrubiella] hemipterigena]
MPERAGSVVSYAAGASLAAVALIYVFGPTFTLDADGSSSKKKTIVGLRNQANDCFINSVLQALAGLGDLRIYLIRETHRRRIENPSVYATIVQPDGQEMPAWKIQGMQDGLVTQGLKDMLDALNERPISKKAISPFPFVRVLETAFKQRISRQQQDAQEFLQIVADRLKDEYHAAQRARLFSKKAAVAGVAAAADADDDESTTQTTTPPSEISDSDVPFEFEDGFPMEGKYESHIKCQTCGYTTKPREETFCTLTLNVPQVNSTSLTSCFDGIFKTEFIDDFKCENCRLLQTVEHLEHEAAKSTSDAFKHRAQESIAKLKRAIQMDPECPPADIDLGDIRYAPKRRIAKTTRMTTFPKILAIHLSRSIYGVGMTQKNLAKVTFPEQLPLGGLADQRKYKLLGVVTHRGGHNSGHYEAFRRQNLPLPFPNANTFQQSGVYSKTPTPISTPEIAARQPDSSTISTPELLASSTPTSSTPSLESIPKSVPIGTSAAAASSTSSLKVKDAETSSLRSVAASTKSALSKLAKGDAGSIKGPRTPPNPLAKRPRRTKVAADRWWRVSDERVREAKTSEVLGMQKEVYLLFYELDRS